MSQDSPHVRRLGSLLGRHRHAVSLGVVATAAATVVFWLATDLFPYHTVNHDEGVYLQQAAMLLEGKLWMAPGSETLREAFRPWFFVESDRGFYPKYTPVTAAVFALGKLAGGFRLALFAVAWANVWLLGTIATAAFEERTGLVAAAIAAASPMFLFQSSVFLPYAPTMMFNMAFALAYVRAHRRGSGRYAVFAGVAAGLAFWARPYTAVLFATPFIIHALMFAWRSGRHRPALLRRVGTTAAVGLGFVGLALAYNQLLTGSALLFPYEAFAPLDGLGFGRRRILGHSLVYTPALALEANGAVVRSLATKWFAAGVFGTALALLGVGAAARGIRPRAVGAGESVDHSTLRLLLLGVAVTVIGGNVLFWGNLNILGPLGDVEDGFISLFGPVYHLDVLLPLSAFAAHGGLSAWDWTRDRIRRRVPRPIVSVVSILLVSFAVVGGGLVVADSVADPIEEHRAYTEKYERANAPIETTTFENALVFIPPEYGEWINHPFQYLRNDPGFDGDVVYAVARGPRVDRAVLEAYPNRTVYRYRYHGDWTPDPRDQVLPLLEELRRVDGQSHTLRTTVSVPDRITSGTVAISTGESVRRYEVEGPPTDPLTVEWTVGEDTVGVEGANITQGSGGSLEGIDRPTRVSLTITITEPTGGTLTYREELLAAPSETGVSIVWPPATSTCTMHRDCGLEGTYIPDRPDTRPEGIARNTTLVDGNA